MDEKVIELIKKDIARCEQQTVNEGSYQLYQALMGKYNGLFPGFSDDIPKSGKVSTGGAFNYRPELNAIKEVLELKLITEQSKDPLFEFKNMFSQDIDSLKRVVDIESDVSEERRKGYIGLLLQNIILMFQNLEKVYILILLNKAFTMKWKVLLWIITCNRYITNCVHLRL